ncbi:MAG: hypothetical protein IPK13_08185 [Deltaproteobacteria bacterium]|nr:hypothetical protein [Deltaproteobacteria bacterium]
MAVAAAVGLSACTLAPQYTADRSISESVELAGEQVLVVDAILPIDFRGARRRSDIQIDIEATLTASSAETAEEMAAALAIEKANTDPSILTLTLAAPTKGFISGTLVITAPSDLDVQIVERGGAVRVDGLEGTLQVDALSDVQVRNAQNNVLIRVAEGLAVLDTLGLPGTTTQVAVGVGDVYLALPTTTLNLTLFAQGQRIIVDHPQLPRVLNTGRPYEATVGVALAAVSLTAQQGAVTIGAR